MQGGRLIDPVQHLDGVGDLYVAAGRIADPPADAEVQTFDARGLIVAPGLIDLHVHLREPGGSHKETIATGTAAAVAGGFTSVACMPNTTPPLDAPEHVEWVSAEARKVGACRVLPIAAVTLGRRGGELVDFEALRGAGALAFSDDGDGIADDQVMRAALRRVRAIDSVLIQHCQDARLTQGGVMHAGPVADTLGLGGMDPLAEEAMIERDLELVGQEGGRYHVAHVSTARAVELVRQAKAAGLPVTTEVCPHHLTLCDRDVLESGKDPNYKMNPPLRSPADAAACVEGLLDGTIDCIVTDHAPHTAEEKATGFDRAPFGIIGLETAVALAYEVLIASGRSDWPTLLRLMNSAPAEALGLPAPTLATGAPADLTIIDPQARWTIDPDRFASKARNTPYAGREVTSRVVATFVNGQLRHLHPDAQPRMT
ncbi:MAG: dihydroorotase [bacterium]|nr:dihydroorotase [bacterium]